MKTLIALLLTSLPALALAQYSNPDKSFYEHAAQGGRVEVAAGKLAQKNGASQAVKDFGAMMVEDHSASNKKLKKLADSKSVKLPRAESDARSEAQDAGDEIRQLLRQGLHREPGQGS